MSPDDRWRVAHMVEAAEQALAFVAGRDRTNLDTDAMLRLALTRAVEIVGEAAGQVTDTGRSELASVPLVTNRRHAQPADPSYFDINRDILWDTVQIALPALLNQLKPVGGGNN